MSAEPHPVPGGTGMRTEVGPQAGHARVWGLCLWPAPWAPGPGSGRAALALTGAAGPDGLFQHLLLLTVS